MLVTSDCRDPSGVGADPHRRPLVAAGTFTPLASPVGTHAHRGTRGRGFWMTDQSLGRQQTFFVFIYHFIPDTERFPYPVCVSRAPLCVSSPLATISFKWLSSALINSSDVFHGMGYHIVPNLCTCRCLHICKLYLVPDSVTTRAARLERGVDVAQVVREWSDADIAVAVVLADVTTSYVLNASKLHDQEQLSEQLQQALDSRVVIEQAKGIIAQRKSVTVDHAYQLMRGHARNNHASLRMVAEAIVGVGLKV